MSSSILKKIVLNWLPLLFAITAFYIFMYFIIQQTYRSQANDPQVQVVEDTSAAFSSGVNPAEYPFQQKTNIEKSLAPFVIVYDANRKPITFSGVLNDAPPIPPAGALEASQNNLDHRFTWEPQKGVRIAAVARYFNSTSTNSSGYVLMGRSLREVESRIATAGKTLLLGWLLTMIGTMWLALYRDRKIVDEEMSEDNENEEVVVVVG